MKAGRMLVTISVIGICSTGYMGFAETEAQEKVEPEAPEVLAKNPIGKELSPVDLAEAFLAVETYVYAKPPGDEQLRVLDRTLNRKTVLTLNSTDKSSEHWLDPHTVALLASFTSEEGDEYELVFAVTEKRGTDTVYHGPFTVEVDALDQMVVQDVGIFSVNGVPRYSFRQKDDGYWELKRIIAREM